MPDNEKLYTNPPMVYSIATKTKLEPLKILTSAKGAAIEKEKSNKLILKNITCNKNSPHSFNINLMFSFLTTKSY